MVDRLLCNYGFLRTADGRHVYFHRNSVANTRFDALRIGVGVAFTEEADEQGPRATTVRVVDARGHDGQVHY
jgi:cold shock CspA family protein